MASDPTHFVGPEKALNIELNKELWIGLAIGFGSLCLICTALVIYSEFCRDKRRAYETVEMMNRRQTHIDRGDHDTWDI
tara:strand:+ start:386 stop:622 length:237 start_codon:yes stop_codon:yes gene_type:complete